MSSSKESSLTYLFGFCVVSCVFSGLSSILSNAQMEASFHQNLGQLTEKNFTGFRSAFQWTIGKSIENNYLRNVISFQINDSLNVNDQLFGSIGIYSQGPQIGVHFSMHSVASSTPGPSFNCSNDSPFFDKNHVCLNSNYSLISNAIYFLDVEIRGKSIRGYISEPQMDFTDMDDPYLPRNLIGEMKWFNELENLRPTHYWLDNRFKSCNLLSEVMTFNYAPEVYNKIKREMSHFGSIFKFSSCGPQSTLIMTDWNKGITYVSKPPPVINETRLLKSIKNISTLN